MSFVNLRSAFVLMILTMAGLLAQFIGVAGEAAHAQAGGLSSPGLPEGIVYAPMTGTLFGTPCCINSKIIQQGGVGDCYLMSSLAAIALVSPGSIQHAIQQNQDGTYSVTLYKPRPGGDPNTAAVVRTVYRINGDVPTIERGLLTRSPVGSFEQDPTGYLQSLLQGPKALASALNDGSQQLFSSSFPYVHPINAYDAYEATSPLAARPGAYNGALWPMLMEKAYAAMIPGGYEALGEGGGGYTAMRAITGAGGGEWVITDKPTNIVRSVSVTNVPSVADRGGHCIICGLFNGKGLTAIEPNVQVCVSLVTAQRPIPRKCTPVCRPGYSCAGQFGQSGFDTGNANAEVMIEVLDIDRPGHENQISLFTKKNPLKCTKQNPCDDQSDGAGAPAAGDPAAQMSISFEGSQQNVANNTVATLDDLDALLTRLKGKAVLAGTISECPSSFRCVNPTDKRVLDHEAASFGQKCAGSGTTCLSPAHEYYVKAYSRGTGSLSQARILLGNPWGPGQDVVLTLPIFQYAFASISSNDVAPLTASNCPCR